LKRKGKQILAWSFQNIFEAQTAVLTISQFAINKLKKIFLDDFDARMLYVIDL
jgi:hypothetical protein